MIRFAWIQLDSLRLIYRTLSGPCLACWCCVFFLASGIQGVEPSSHITDADREWFENRVRPVLEENCISCHSKQVGKVGGNLSMDSREEMLTGGDSGPAIEPKNIDESLLVSAIRRESYEMPPEKPLGKTERAVLEEWIERGAPWPEYQSDAHDQNWLQRRARSHWAWKPPKAVSEAEQVEASDSIDLFLQEKLDEAGVTPSGDAEPAAILRRLTYDLTGLPPSREQILAFDTRLNSGKESVDEVIAQTADELLASPQFGVHWARHWLDLVRYSETMGHEFDFSIPNAWRYRDAIIEAFNSDVPYHQVVTEHIAGDLVRHPRISLRDGSNQSLTMTSWWWMGDSVQAPVDLEVDYSTRLDNQIDVFSKAFLGMTVACARCHDHKFDAIAAKDYYGLAGILRSSRRTKIPTDPTQRISQLAHQNLQEMQRFEQDKNVVIEANSERVQQWLNEAIARLAESPVALSPTNIADASSVLHPLIQYDNKRFEESWQQLRDQVATAQNSYEKWLAQTELLGNFDDGIPSGWQVYDAAGLKDAYQVTAGERLWFTAQVPGVSPRGLFSSRKYGNKQAVVLQSPDFLVQRKCIHVLARGHAALSSVVVGGFYMNEYHDLLFGDLRKQVNNSQLQWVTHRGDLQKYVGYTGYLSFQDSYDGWFEIAEVRASDETPPLQPSSWLKQLTQREKISRDELIHELEKLFLQATSTGTQSSHEPAVEQLSHLSHQLGLVWPVTISPQATNVRDNLFVNDAACPAPLEILSISEGTPVDAFVAVRGNPHQPGERAPRGILQEVLSQPSVPAKSSGRLELAQSLISDSHPLVVRVYVNRVWQKLLGEGIVATPDNFGVLGARPSHPELLDYLVSQFKGGDWSTKRLIKTIVLTQAYRRSSSSTDMQQELDAEGSLLSRARVRRLSAESIRDSLLSMTGQLDLQLGGPPVPVYLTAQMTGRGRPGQSGPLDGSNRRTIFVELRKNFLNPFLLTFDMPLPATTVGRRNDSNVPAQALCMLNDPLVDLVCQRWLEMHRSEIAVASEEQQQLLLKDLFLQAFAREPSEEEASVCMDLLRASGGSSDSWYDVVHTVINMKEFVFLR